MLGWLEGPQSKTDNFRIIYENDEIAVCHQFMEFSSGDKDAVMMVYKNYRWESIQHGNWSHSNSGKMN